MSKSRRHHVYMVGGSGSKEHVVALSAHPDEMTKEALESLAAELCRSSGYVLRVVEFSEYVRANRRLQYRRAKRKTLRRRTDGK